MNPFAWLRRNSAPAPPPVAGPPPDAGWDTRSLENPATPVTPEQLASLISFGPTRSGVQIDERTALSAVAVLACVRILSESVGMLPMAVFEGDEDDPARTRCPKHPVYPLLRWRPNAEMSASVLRETLMGHLGLWNNAYARITFSNAGLPIEIAPLDPSRTHPERVGGTLKYVVEGGGGTFDVAEIIHIRGLSFNGLKGYQTIGLIREAIALAKAMELYAATFFGSGGNVGGIISMPGVLRPEQRAKWLELWQKAYGGLQNAHKTALVDGDAKYSRIGTAPDEGQMLESRRFQKLEIAQHYRIPPHMLGDMTQGTGRNIEQLSLEFLTYTLGPWLGKFEEEFTQKLLGVGGDYHARFDERRLLRTDLQARKDYYSTAVQWGWMNPAEVRREEGMAPAGPELDAYLRAVNMAPATPAGAEPPPAPGGKDEPAPTPVPGGQRSAAAQSLLPVFTDAIGRMLRKEANALSRGMTAEKADRFYAEHRGHVRDALAAPLAALAALVGGDLGGSSDTGAAAIATLAEERHAAGGSVEELASAKAKDLVQRLIAEKEDNP